MGEVGGLTSCIFLLLLSPTFLLFIPVPPWPSPYWFLVPGPFCQSTFPQLQCCSGRTDDCSVPILDTRCYCDAFCNRTGSSDCCPDYFTHCEGLNADNQPAQIRAATLRPPASCPYGTSDISDPTCLYRGGLVRDRDMVEENCNQCKCQASESDVGCMEVVCTTNRCMVEEKEIKEIEESSFHTWTPTKFSGFWGKTLEEGINRKLGAEKPKISASLKAHLMSAVQLSYSPSSLPSQFSALATWPGLITPVSDQGWCSSSWAVSAAAVAGDRTSIGQNRSVVLSPEALLSCNKRGPIGCVSTHVDYAWDQLRRQGSWSSSCQSNTTNTVTTKCPSHCPMFRTLPAYRVGRGNTYRQPNRNEQDIMYEILHQGPVQAVMEVYTDFFMYGSGIYRKTDLPSNTLAGHHAVRIVGWGEEGVDNYWTVANSWGTDWGENGFFRIAKGDNECLLEEFVMAVWPSKKTSRRTRRNRGRTATRNKLTD